MIPLPLPFNQLTSAARNSCFHTLIMDDNVEKVKNREISNNTVKKKTNKQKTVCEVEAMDYRHQVCFIQWLANSPDHCSSFWAELLIEKFILETWRLMVTIIPWHSGWHLQWFAAIHSRDQTRNYFFKDIAFAGFEHTLDSKMKQLQSPQKKLAEPITVEEESSSTQQGARL